MKKLRTRMILIVFLSSAVIFALTFVLFRGALVRYQNQQADGMTLIISSYGGEVPEVEDYSEEDLTGEIPHYGVSISEESAFRTRYFVVALDSSGASVSASLDHVASVDESTAFAMAESALESGSGTGYYGTYRWRVVESSGGITVIFLDCEENFTFRRATTMIAGTLCVLFPLLITLIFGLFSKRAMKPFEENARRQRQFITDASHELKTPLAIISANAEVLEYKAGQNEWIDNITGQTGHMAELIDDLLTLAKMDEYEGDPDLTEVNLTDLVQRKAADFAEVFRRKEVSVQTEITGEILLTANAKQLSMLLSILIENAAKYVTDGGKVRMTLYVSGKYAFFEIENTAMLEGGQDLEKLFDRFYRPDSSRNSKTGGQGIGLSTARKIAELHGGSLTARRTEGGICFTAALSVKMRR